MIKGVSGIYLCIIERDMPILLPYVPREKVELDGNSLLY